MRGLKNGIVYREGKWWLSEWSHTPKLTEMPGKPTPVAGCLVHRAFAAICAHLDDQE